MNPAEIKQGSLVTPKMPVVLGRMKAHPGQTFWVTCSSIGRADRGKIHIARSGKSAGHAVMITLLDFERFFSTV